MNASYVLTLTKALLIFIGKAAQVIANFTFIIAASLS